MPCTRARYTAPMPDYLLKWNARIEALLGAGTYRLLRYLISGGTAAASNVLFLFLLVHFAVIHYLLASVIAFLMSAVVSFTMQKFWTFQDTVMKNLRTQFGRYLIALLTNLCVNTLLMYLFVEKMGMWYVYAQILTTAIVAVIGYFIYKYFVFRARPIALP